MNNLTRMLWLLVAVVVIACTSHAQCTKVKTGGTDCQGPLTVVPSATNPIQDSIILFDLSQGTPLPAAGKYILSILNGAIAESDNGAAYHPISMPKTFTITCGPATGTLAKGFKTLCTWN